MSAKPVCINSSDVKYVYSVTAARSQLFARVTAGVLARVRVRFASALTPGGAAAED